MALERELGGPMTITGIGWQRTGEGHDWGTYLDVQMYMGIFDDDNLTAFFDSNYAPGTRTLVYSTDSLHLEGAPGEWVTLDLEQPYSYSGTGNLVIEIQRDGTCDNTFLMTWRWYTAGYRMLTAGSHDAASGYRDRVASMLRIEYSQGLEQGSWAHVKSLFAGAGRTVHPPSPELNPCPAAGGEGRREGSSPLLP